MEAVSITNHPYHTTRGKWQEKRQELQPVGKTGASNQKNEFLPCIDVNEVE